MKSHETFQKTDKSEKQKNQKQKNEIIESKECLQNKNYIKI